MTSSDRAAPRPRLAVLAVLVVAAVASLATGAPIPTARAQVNGELPIDGGTTQTRELHIHLVPASGAATGPRAGRLEVSLRSAGDLGPAYSPWIGIGAAPLDSPPVPPITIPNGVTGITGGNAFVELPFATCNAGCDLAYRLTFAAADELGRGAIIRYRADASFEYDYSGSLGVLSVALSEGTVSGPPTTLISLLVVAVVALLVGLFIGQRWRRNDRRRLVPVGIMIALLLIVTAWSPLLYLVYLVAPRAVIDSGLSLPLDLDLNVALFSSLVLGSLAGGLVVGARRWTADGGWSLGLAAVATVELGGIWLGWTISASAAIRPVQVGIALAGLGVVLGVIVGQTWFRPEAGIAGRRLVPSLAVVSQGILCAGFACLAVNALDLAGISLGAQQTLLAVPLALAVAIVLAGLWRWFRGSRWLMALVNLVLSIVGLLGFFLWQGLTNSTGASTNDTLLANLAIGLEVAAAIVGFVVSLVLYRPTGKVEPGLDATAEPTTEPGAARVWRRP